MQSLPDSFLRKKQKIISDLAIPDAEYDDLSPKGSVDAGIRGLITDINANLGYVTTSSCAGRISVFLEGRKRMQEVEGQLEEKSKNSHPSTIEEIGDRAGREGQQRERLPKQQNRDNEGKPSFAGQGGKGGGGKWLFVSHHPVDMDKIKTGTASHLGFNSPGDGLLRNANIATRRLVHFKFEPMILHVLTGSPEYAQMMLQAALQAGFRESGAVNVASTGAKHDDPVTPMVAVRSMGLGFESIIGFGLDDDKSNSNSNSINIDNEDCVTIPIVSNSYLEMLIVLANERFAENKRRIDRFWSGLMKEKVDDTLAMKSKEGVKAGSEAWEDTESRRLRKREEGLRKRERTRAEKRQDDADIGSLELGYSL